MEGIKLNVRLVFLAAVVLCAVVIVSVRLYGLQIVSGDSFRAQSERSIARTVSVPAARGEIVDRYGRPLVTNRLCYNISIDFSRLPKDMENETILELLELCGEYGFEHEDTLPITTPPYLFLSSATQQQQSRFEKYAEKQGWGKDLAPHEYMQRLRELYKIEGYSEPQSREIAGVRYELDLRGVLNLSAYVFSEDVDIALVSALRERGLPGIMVDTAAARVYRTQFAAHILGRVGPIFEEEYQELKEKGYKMDESVGKDGMEKALEEYLHGTAGRRLEETNLAGKVTNVMYSEPPQPGDNCMLTIDIRLQEVAERSLAALVPRLREEGTRTPTLGGYDAQGASVVAVDVKTGEVLCMASYPTYSLSTFSQDFRDLNEDPLKPMYNRAIAGTYAPGSTFKMVTSVAALEEGIITPKTRILDRGVYMYYAPSYTPKCLLYRSSGGSHGNITVSDALKVSCNYFFYEVGRLLTIDRLDTYAKMFGLGEKSGIELEGEQAGILAGPEDRARRNIVRWQGGDTLQMAIGQSDNSFTPLQIANYVATFSNGGTHYVPHLLKSVKSYDYGDTRLDVLPEVSGVVPMKKETFDTVMQGMLSVSEEGTAANVFRNYPIKVGSKTGSAQTGVTGQSANGVFVAFAPFDDPEIAIAVIVERGGSGNRIAPVARDIFDAYFRIGASMEETIPENTLLR